MTAKWYPLAIKSVPQYSFTGNNNRLDASSGVTYDTPGNVTNDGLGHTYFYDAENRLVQVGGTQGQCSTATACYIYDAEGRRAGKTLGASSVYYLYDLGGKEVAEVSSAGVWNRGEVYAGSRHLATYSGGASGVTYFATADWLGTERMRTGMSGPTVETCTSQPFGDAQTCTGSEVSPMHFTGQHFDSESFLSHMDFRSMSPTQGRWTSMDPARMAAADAENPQSWNLYAYVLNNPLRLVDPSGLEPQGGTTGPTTPGGCDNDDQSTFCLKVDVWEKDAQKAAQELAKRAQMALILLTRSNGVHHGAPRQWFRRIQPGEARDAFEEWTTEESSVLHTFNRAHRAYSKAMETIEELGTQEGRDKLFEDGAEGAEKVMQKILDSENPAIKGYLDENTTTSGTTFRESLERALGGDGEALGDLVSGVAGTAVEEVGEIE